MAARRTTFERIYHRGAEAEVLPVYEQRAKDWFRDVSQTVRVVPRKIMIENLRKQTPALRGRRILGNMYCFFYEPKMKETLDYYDRFPLVFPIENYDDGFLALNMHYLPPILSARFMDNFYYSLNNEKYDSTTKLRPTLIEYDILNGLAKYKYYRPCIKRYLTSQVSGKFLKVDPKDWEIALFLPMDRFKGARRQRVWKESRDTIRKQNT